MEQHPIPQQISSYQFRLVGDMTLKQFFQLAGGALFSLLFYASPLNPLIKWPFVIFFAILGVALAFLPLEERPLDRWIVAFFRSIYSPTIFFWQKGAYQPNFYQDEAPMPAEKIIAPGGEAALSAYLSQSATPKSPFFKKLEDAESGFLTKMNDLFGPGSAPSGQINISPATGRREFTVPQNVPTPKLNVVVEEKVPQAEGVSSDIKLSSVSATVESLGTLSGKSAQFSLAAAPPSPPTIPNTIVGQVLDLNEKIIEGAILEIRDAGGRPVRALKTNKVGHFMVVTPLMPGRYEIITEKDGFSFDPITFNALGEIIPPILIHGKAVPKLVVTEQPTAATVQPNI